MALPTFSPKVDRITQPGNRINLVVADDINQIVNCLQSIYSMLGNVTVRTCISISSVDFTGPYYQNPKLINLTPEVDFRVFTNEGSGTLQDWDVEGYGDGGYIYEASTGKLTMPIQKYNIEIYTKLPII